MLDRIEFGDRRLVGQPKARQQLLRALQSGRTSHAYLFSGPEGSGKTAFALAFAELLNGVDNLTDLKGNARSKKSTWYRHPDIHFFLPLPKKVTESKEALSEEMKSRLELLEKDPYEVVDFTLRPTLGQETSSTSRTAFYPIKFFNKVIRRKSHLKPNEGRYSVVIVTNIETMKPIAANAFLKLLEEPPKELIFLLTSTYTDQLMPTILSRCQPIKLTPLSDQEITEALVRHENVSREDATLLARISGGNYSLARRMDLARLRESRDDVIVFLRMSYTQDAGALLPLIQDWQSKLNTENQIVLCNTMEMFLRDLMIYRETGEPDLITNVDKLDVIQKFCETVNRARLEEMIEQLNALKGLLYQNVQFKLVFTALSFRFSYLMRGSETPIRDEEHWQHLPALTPESLF